MDTNVQSIIDSKFSDKEKISKIHIVLERFKDSKNTPHFANAYYELGVLYFKTNSNEKAINYFNKAIEILSVADITYLKELNKARYYLSWLYMNMGKKNEQIAILNKIINDKGNDIHTLNATIALAMIAIEKGDYYLALKRLNLKLAQKNSIHDEVFLKIRLIGIYAQMFEDNWSDNTMASHISTIKMHQNYILKNFNHTQLDKKTLYEFYNNLANIYEALTDYKTALQFYTKSKQYFKQEQNETEYYYVLNNIGYLYGKEGKTDLASSCFKEIINNATDSNQLATAYDNYAYFSKLKPLAKIVYYEKAIQTILALKQSTFILPELQTIIESGYQQDIMVYLVDLASNYVETFKATHEKVYLLKAKDVLYLIDKIVSIIRYESSSEQSKLFWIEKGVNTYLLGTEVCYLLNEPHEGFYFMEKNKALLLQENINTYQAKLELLLPQEIRDKEFKLHYEYVLADIKLQQFPNNKSIRAAYIKKHREFESFMRSLTHQYPEYVKLKHKIDIMPLQKVIRALKNNECFVTYILNNDKGYGLFANASNTYFFKIDNITQLYQDSNFLRKLHTQFSFKEQEKKKFQQISNRVFTTLFPFTNALQKVKGKKLTIIADGILLHLPFEALCINRIQKLQESYLINFTEISYLQSYSTFEKIKQWKNKPSKKLLAIIPYQFTNKKLEMLARSKELLAPLGRYASSTILFDSQANKEIFKNISNQYEIIHLNTHAGVDNSNQMPWIAFQNSKMTLQELYGVSNHASLVILDACKTNDGKVLSGEGIFSLSRGFFMNGTKSVLSSLWNVNEKAGNEIISSFYKELEKGNSKSKALQLAKISYLKNHQLSEIVPYHWASFVLTGETATLQLKQKWYYNEGNIIVAIILIVITLFVVFSLKFLKK